MKRNIALLALTASAGLCLGIAFGCAGKEDAKDYHRQPDEKAVAKPQPALKPALDSEEGTISRADAQGAGGGVEGGGGNGGAETAGAGLGLRQVITQEDRVCDASVTPQEGQEPCVIIPVNDCIPCGEPGDKITAVNRDAAKRIMQPRKDVCLPKIKDMMEKKTRPKGSRDKSCQALSKAVCQNDGHCGLVPMSEEEMKQLQEKYEQMQKQGQGGGEQGGGQGAPGAGR